ncbi:hypothetical protein Trco_005319 [Trichoderma cornu-damae]|uniref:Uncharacterized protein n=1 Tax=Trichoderma cornu-damae TaxID=654480 RepID=A0A9P8QJ46_9HYPO|nr:hypothetical protein Trco_005319 [Trichoderma cornu-damae]
MLATKLGRDIELQITRDKRSFDVANLMRAVTYLHAEMVHFGVSIHRDPHQVWKDVLENANPSFIAMRPRFREMMDEKRVVVTKDEFLSEFDLFASEEGLNGQVVVLMNCPGCERLVTFHTTAALKKASAEVPQNRTPQPIKTPFDKTSFSRTQLIHIFALQITFFVPPQSHARKDAQHRQGNSALQRQYNRMHHGMKQPPHLHLPLPQGGGICQAISLAISISTRARQYPDVAAAKEAAPDIVPEARETDDQAELSARDMAEAEVAAVDAICTAPEGKERRGGRALSGGVTVRDDDGDDEAFVGDTTVVELAGELW